MPMEEVVDDAHHGHDDYGPSSSSAEITFLVEDIEAILEMNRLLEEENQQLKQEVARLKSQIATLKAHDLERKTNLWKKIHSSYNPNSTTTSPSHDCITTNNPQQQQQQQQLKKQTAPTTTDNNNATTTTTTAATTTNPTSAGLPSINTSRDIDKATAHQKIRPIVGGPVPPPPPPPPPGSLMGTKKVKRVPEVIEFYRLLTRRNAQMDNRGNNAIAVLGDAISSKNMIGEIEDRSTYLSAIKSDVETRGELIHHLIQKIENAAFKDIAAVDSFVKWLDGQLSCLVDERAVLKHFPRWPERKADMLREAACTYRDLKLLDTDISETVRDANPKHLTLTLTQMLGKIQALQDRLERSVGDVENTREGACKRYREFQIPWEWMLDTGFLGKIKLRSLKLAREYMKMTVKELNSPRCYKAEDLVLQGVRFAYRAHQFAGGFDTDTMEAFEELKQLYCTKLSPTQ